MIRRRKMQASLVNLKLMLKKDVFYLRCGLIHDRDQYLNKLVWYHFAVFIFFHSVIKKDVSFVFVIIGIFDAKILLSFSSCTLINVKSKSEKKSLKLRQLFQKNFN